MTSVTSPGEPGADLTVDGLAAATGLSVRTARYYAGLGLVPPPERRGRVAYYGPAHVSRLRLVRDLQEHGYTLAAIERLLAGVPLHATAAELAVQRAMLTAWAPGEWAGVDRPGLDDRAGRALSDQDVAWLVDAGAVRRDGARFQAHPQLRLAVELRELGMPAAGMAEADAAVRRHMAQLADELTDVLRRHVLGRYRGDLSPEQAVEFERTFGHLRSLTLEAIAGSFQEAAHQLAVRALSPPGGRSDAQ